MNKDKIIYAKSYPTLTPEEEALLDKQIELEAKKYKSSLPETAEELLRDMRENTRYELNEEKYKDKDTFLKFVKVFCEAEQTDVVITEEEFGYIATFDLSIGMYGGYIKMLFLKCLMMADTFDILPPKDDNKCEFKIILTYYTHDIYYKDEKREWF